MTVQLTTRAIDQSTYLVTAVFTDESAVAVTPDTLTWTLTDVAGAVINAREDVAATPAATNNILLQGDDLKLSEGKTRILFFEGTYTSSLGAGLPLVESATFALELTPYTYDLDTTIGKVRSKIGDTNFATDSGVRPDGTNFTDDEITVELNANNGEVARSAASLCDTLAIQWAGAGETVNLGGYQISTIAKSLNYQKMASRLRGLKVTFRAY